jgi:3-hydroxyacyl-CoA dehydrogenase
MKAGAGHPMGPLTLADVVGLDTLGAISEVMFDEFREHRFARPPTLRRMLAAGWLAQKSGMPFYATRATNWAQTRRSGWAFPPAAEEEAGSDRRPLPCMDRTPDGGRGGKPWRC